MKAKILSTLALAAGMAGLQAQTVIDIVGSTAGRAAVHNSILNTLTGVTYGYTGSTLSGAGYAIFKGNYGSTPVIVRTSWSGSATGLSTLATGANANFIPTSTVVASGGTSGLANGNDPSAAEIAFSDVYVGATTVPSTGLVNTNTFVLPFKWVASNKAIAAGLTNITSIQARALLSVGSLPLSFFTGIAADASTTVIATGRDNGSGTRITALADIGYGVNNAVSQAEVVLSGNNITGLKDFAQGPNYGYTSGGTLAGVLNKQSTGDAADYIILGYLGLTDAATALNPDSSANPFPAKELTYNGAAYSAVNVETGKYSFWGYSHMYYKSTLDSTSKTYANALGVNLKANPGAVGLDSTLMSVTRATDGGTILPLE